MTRKNLDIMLAAAGAAGIAVSITALLGWAAALLVVSLALVALALVV